MKTDYTTNYLLDKKVTIYQPSDGYRAAIDAVLLSSLAAVTKPGKSILDVGSGTGAVSLCLAERFKQLRPKITGLEIQQELVELSNKSAAANGFGEFLEYIYYDIRKKNVFLEQYDHVVTNPPYSEADMVSPKPGKATAHNHEDFSLKEWLDFCLKRVKPKGFFYTINRASAVDEILSVLNGRAGNMMIVPVYSKAGQEAKRVMVVAQKDSKAPSRISTGLVMHDEDGEYSFSAQKILKEGKGIMEADCCPCSQRK